MANATTVPVFKMVETKEVPTKAKVLSAEERAAREGIKTMLEQVKSSGKAAMIELSAENTAKHLGIRIGRMAVEMGLKGQFETTNDGKNFWVKFNAPKGNGATAPASA